MTRTSCLAALMALSALLFPGTLVAQTPEAAAAKLDTFLDRFPDLGPGYAVVVVTPDEVLLRHVDGARRASSGEPLTADTPLYIASQTKAYIGLLAARLDAEGILSLDDHMTDHWPDLVFPEGVEAADWTLRDLLSHQVPIEVGYITFLEAYVTELDPADYPALIAEHAETREPGFQYDNLGYNIWAAVLETATGKSWRTWLDEKLFEPFGLEHTSSRTSDFPLDEISWNHIWMGESNGWFDVRPKTDAMMQSAGGLVTSVNDMAIWLQANLSGAVLEGTGITSAMIEVAHAPTAEIDPGEPNSYELPCSAYALGWNICDFEGRELFIHGGGYTGARTMMAFSPEMGAGIGVFSNSDNMTGWLTSRTVVQFFQYLIEHEDAEPMADLRERVYPERVNRMLSSNLRELATRRADKQWGDWSWKPAKDGLGAFEGRFTMGDSYKDVKIRNAKGQLLLVMGGLRAWLAPAQPDLFGVYTGPFSGPDPIAFQRSEDGVVTGFEMDGDSYQRVEP
jgi:CubicO group peptidase (beta-lactamase class C family)